jgi:hypothetical protein
MIYPETNAPFIPKFNVLYAIILVNYKTNVRQKIRQKR